MKNQSLKIILIVLLLFNLPCLIFADEYEVERRRMVQEQIKDKGIGDEKVLEVMRQVPRHEFVPNLWRFLAYADRPLPIGEGQTISQPYMVALMTELLALKGNEKVLEIGTGSGYQAAVLAEMVSQVYTIEIIPQLAQTAETKLKELGYQNIYVRCGDGYNGWPEAAPFDAIMVTCGAEQIPPPLTEQLAEGGRMVIPVGRGWQKLLLVKKENGQITSEFITDVIFVPLTGEHE